MAQRIKQKRKQFDIKEKSRIISRLESGEKNIDLAKEYGVPHSTISSMWKKRDTIKALFDSNLLKMKRARRTKHTNIEEALLKWYKYQRANNVPVNGPTLQEKAKEIATRLGVDDFTSSHGWIQRYRMRNGIAGGKAGDDTPGVSGVLENWLETKWPTWLFEGYAPDEIFNAVETGLFYNMKPHMTSKFKGDQCSSGRWPTARLTIMVAANVTGTSKSKLLAIGNSKTLKFFTKKQMPVAYEDDEKSWMTSKIFKQWLRNWDAELEATERKIIVLVDNSPAHSLVTDLKWIKLVFLPPNLASALQPMNLGVIRCLKSNYRTLQVLKMLQNMENDDRHAIALFDALLILSEAWEKVSKKDIARCFEEAGFKELLAASDVVDPLDMQLSVDDKNNITLAQLAANLQPSLSQAEVDDFIDVDSCLATSAPASEEDIMLEEEAEEEFKVPSLNEGLQAINVLRKIIMCNDNFRNCGNYDEMLVQMQRELQNSYARQKCSEHIKVEYT